MVGNERVHYSTITALLKLDCLYTGKKYLVFNVFVNASGALLSVKKDTGPKESSFLFFTIIIQQFRRHAGVMVSSLD